MAKSAGAGEMRTRVTVCRMKSEKTSNGYDSENAENVYEDGRSLHCKWQNAHGSEALEAEKLGLKEPATLTVRYNPRIAPDCIIYKAGDEMPYEIISIDNVEDAGKFMEIKVKRTVPAK